LFNIKSILEKKGHTVIPFSVKHKKNIPSEYENYFINAVGKGDEVYANEYNKNSFKTLSTVIGRMLYSFEAKKKLKKLIKDTSPDLVYVLYFQNKMSASVIDAAYELKVPVVQRISDFGHICVNNIFYIYQKKEICERCLTGSRLNGVKYKCVNQSYLQSLLKVIALQIQDFRKTTRKISAFVIPAAFTLRKFKQAGIEGKKLNHIPTFYNTGNTTAGDISYGDYFLYIGRVDPDKGILTLVKAFENTPYKLLIAGSSIEGYDKEVKSYLDGKNHHITFLGHLDFPAISMYLKSCLCTICPSEWYDNMPNAVLESYAHQKGVIASRLGALIELVQDQETGLHFNAGDYLDLREKITYLSNQLDIAKRYGQNGFGMLQTQFSENLHYERLMHVFNSVTGENN